MVFIRWENHLFPLLFFVKLLHCKMTMTQIAPEHSQDDSALASRSKSLFPPPHHQANNINHRSLDSISPNPSSRPKLHTMHSSDTSRFPTLERLENSMMFSKNSKITIEPVTFPGDYTSGNNNNNNNNNMTKSNGSQVCLIGKQDFWKDKSNIQCFMCL